MESPSLNTSALDRINSTVSESVEQLKVLYSEYNKKLVALSDEHAKLQMERKTINEAKEILKEEDSKYQNLRNTVQAKIQQVKQAHEAIKERENNVKIEEDKLKEREQKIEEREQELKEKEDHMSSLEERMNATLIAPSNQVKLNIGGKRYSSSIDTLTSEKNTFFSGMLNGTYEPNKMGEYFIDRDGTLFYIILNHLRGYSTEQAILQLNNTKRLRLIEDLDFYGIGHWCCKTCGIPHFTSPPQDMKCCYDWVCTKCEQIECEEMTEPPPQNYLCHECELFQPRDPYDDDDDDDW